MPCNCSNVEKSGLWASIPQTGLTEMLPGEDPECYMQRAPDDQDKAGGSAPSDKIATNAIVPDCEMKIDVQFTLTPGSPTDKFKPPVSWKMVSPDNNEMVSISGLTFTESGKLSGQTDEYSEGRTYNVKIIASDSTGAEIDSRSYSFSPKKCVTGSDLKFIHPLPGSTMTSPFGPRVHPVTGKNKDHKGCDFAYAGGVTKDALASCDGKVVKAGEGSGYGNVVYIQHFNGSGKMMAETRYAHLAKIYVSVGQTVSAGQPVGKEGNTGIGTGCHLHFELRLPGDKPVDPLSYINGKFNVAEAATTENGADPGTPAGTTTCTSNTNKAVTTAKVDAAAKGCTSPIPTNSPLPPPGESEDKQVINPQARTDCKPENTPSKDEVKSRISAVLDKHPDLDQSDKDFIMTTAKIESSYDPYAKNPNTSATGLFQMLDKTAKTYYGKMGVEPSCENRCNVEYATEAMIRFYKDEILAYWNGYNSSGKTKIAGKTIKDTPFSQQYPSLSKSIFCYGLIHHDGVGNAVNGIDRQGVQYAKKYFA